MIICTGRKPTGRFSSALSTLIKDIQRSPFEGIGKPEPLKHELSGYCRRINDEHRLIYQVESDALLIAQLRYHYQ